MPAEFNKVTNANVYLEGRSLLGRCKSVDLPKVVTKTTEFEGLGLYGSPEFPSGLDKMEATFEWTSFDETIWRRITNPFQAFDLQVRANVENWDSRGRASELPLVCLLKGNFKSVDSKIEHHEKGTWTSQMTVLYYKIMFNGSDICEVDVLANMYLVDGVDLLSQYRSNLGI